MNNDSSDSDSDDESMQGREEIPRQVPVKQRSSSSSSSDESESKDNGECKTTEGSSSKAGATRGSREEPSGVQKQEHMSSSECEEESNGDAKEARAATVPVTSSRPAKTELVATAMAALDKQYTRERGTYVSLGESPRVWLVQVPRSVTEEQLRGLKLPALTGCDAVLESPGARLRVRELPVGEVGGCKVCVLASGNCSFRMEAVRPEGVLCMSRALTHLPPPTFQASQDSDQEPDLPPVPERTLSNKNQYDCKRKKCKREPEEDRKSGGRVWSNENLSADSSHEKQREKHKKRKRDRDSDRSQPELTCSHEEATDHKKKKIKANENHETSETNVDSGWETREEKIEKKKPEKAEVVDNLPTSSMERQDVKEKKKHKHKRNSGVDVSSSVSMGEDHENHSYSVQIPEVKQEVNKGIPHLDSTEKVKHKKKKKKHKDENTNSDGLETVKKEIEYKKEKEETGTGSGKGSEKKKKKKKDKERRDAGTEIMPEGIKHEIGMIEKNNEAARSNSLVERRSSETPGSRNGVPWLDPSDNIGTTGMSSGIGSEKKKKKKKKDKERRDVGTEIMPEGIKHEIGIIEEKNEAARSNSLVERRSSETPGSRNGVPWLEPSDNIGTEEKSKKKKEKHKEPEQEIQLSVTKQDPDTVTEKKKKKKKEKHDEPEQEIQSSVIKQDPDTVTEKKKKKKHKDKH